MRTCMYTYNISPTHTQTCIYLYMYVYIYIYLYVYTLTCIRTYIVCTIRIEFTSLPTSGATLCRGAEWSPSASATTTCGAWSSKPWPLARCSSMRRADPWGWAGWSYREKKPMENLEEKTEQEVETMGNHCINCKWMMFDEDHRGWNSSACSPSHSNTTGVYWEGYK